MIVDLGIPYIHITLQGGEKEIFETILSLAKERAIDLLKKNKKFPDNYKETDFRINIFDCIENLIDALENTSSDCIEF